LVSGSHSTALLQCGDATTTEPSSAGPSPPTHRKTGASLPGRQKVSFTKKAWLHIREEDGSKWSCFCSVKYCAGGPTPSLGGARSRCCGVEVRLRSIAVCSSSAAVVVDLTQTLRFRWKKGVHYPPLVF